MLRYSEPGIRRSLFNAFHLSWSSSDGWEVSLVNFMIPNADSSSDNGEHGGALFGVSLVLQQNDVERAVPCPAIELVVDKAASSLNATGKYPETPGREGASVADGESTEPRPFASPIKLFSPGKEVSESSSMVDAHTCKISVREGTPIFNRRMEEGPWTRRLGERQAQPRARGGLRVADEPPRGCTHAGGCETRTIRLRPRHAPPHHRSRKDRPLARGGSGRAV